MVPNNPNSMCSFFISALPEPILGVNSNNIRPNPVPRSTVVRSDLASLEQEESGNVRTICAPSDSGTHMAGRRFVNERTTSMEDASLARRLQEEQDEEFARMLQVCTQT